MAVNNNHHGRSRRALRISSQAGNRQYRQQQQKSMATREPIITEPPSITAFRARFEAGRSFDLDDDMEFCPNLLSFDEVCTTKDLQIPNALLTTRFSVNL